jgi:hypothetical protein
MNTIVRAIFSCLLFAANISTFGKESSKIETDFAFNLWADTCLEYAANYQDLIIWARANNLRKVDAHFSKQMLQGDKGEAWRLSHNQNDYFLVIANTEKCAVWATRASAMQINDAFKALISSMPNKPELESDKTIEGHDGKYRQIAYFTQNENDPVGWVYIATTSTNDTAAIQARLTMSKAKE